MTFESRKAGHDMRTKKITVCIFSLLAILASFFLLSSCEGSKDPYDNLEDAINNTFSSSENGDFFDIIQQSTVNGSIEVSAGLGFLSELEIFPAEFPISDVKFKIYNDSKDVYTLNRRQIDVALSNGESASLTASMLLDATASKLYLSSSALDKAYSLDFKEQAGTSDLNDPFSAFVSGLSAGSDLNAFVERYSKTIADLAKKYATAERVAEGKDVTVTFEMTTENLALFVADLFNTIKNDTELESLINSFASSSGESVDFSEIFSEEELNDIKQSVTESGATGKMEALIKSGRLSSMSVTVSSNDFGPAALSLSFDENGSISADLTVTSDGETENISVEYKVEKESTKYTGKLSFTYMEESAEVFEISIDESSKTYSASFNFPDIVSLGVSGSYDYNTKDGTAEISINKLSASVDSSSVSVSVDEVDISIKFDSSAKVPAAPSETTPVESFDSEFISELLQEISEDDYAMTLISLFTSVSDDSYAG